jgi:DNA/RNA-binding domain of Phe-tRNA-synthetase-like protein
LKFSIDNELIKKNRNLQIGVLFCTNVNNNYGKNYEEINNLLESEEKRVFERKNITEDERIVCWRRVYSSFGAKDKKHHSSIESLCKTVKSGKRINRINPIVDIYNAISLRYLIPIGGDDFEKIDGDISLTYAKGDEIFIKLNDKEITNPKKDEIVYKDEKDILCRRWNWRECDKTKITTETQKVCLFIEGLEIITQEMMTKIINDLKINLSVFCTENIITLLLNSSNSKVEF